MGVLDGKVAAITGASSGIGEATAELLAGEGAAVALAARRKDRLDLVKRIEGASGKAIAIEADVSDESQAKGFVEQAALPLIRERGGGSIVNVASTAGRQATLGAGVYNFTKFGVVGFSEALRQEALHSNVRVTIIEPGFTDTELQGHNEHPMVVDATEKMREQIGDLLQAEDIANAILFAVSQPQHVSVNEILIRPTKQQR